MANSEELTMSKLQQLTYYICNLKMSKSQRDVVDRAIVMGILTGKLDVDSIFPPAEVDPTTSVSRFFSQLQQQGGGEFAAMELYGRYCAWCRDTDAVIATTAKFFQTLPALGAQRAKRESGNFYTIAGVDMPAGQRREIE